MSFTLSMTPTTELEAVNAMLMAINESPVNVLDDSEVVDCGRALVLLRRESRALQTKGWAFNTELAMPLAPAADGTTPLPANSLGVTFVGVDTRRHLTARSGKVYDAYNQTFTLDRTVYANVVVLLTWDDIPEDARRFVFVTAMRKFQDAVLGDSALHQFEAADEAAAWADLIGRESENDNHNVLCDSITVRRTFRGRIGYGYGLR